MSEIKMPTEKDILNIKKKAEQGRDKYISAKSTMAEVEKNIKTHENELKEIGINPDNAEEYLVEKETSIKNKYNEILNMLPQD